MKMHFLILLLLCAVGLSYGSSYVSSDSAFNPSTDTIKIGKTDRNSYYYKGYKPLTDSELDFLLKDAHDDRVDNYLKESKVEKNNFNLLIGLLVLAVIVLGVVVGVSIFLLFASVVTGSSGSAGGAIIAGILSGVALFTMPFLSRSAKNKSNDLKRKAVERYNEIVKAQK